MNSLSGNSVRAHLKEALPIDPKRVHVVGFSNGGWELHPLAFDEELRPCSATWVAAGFRGGQVPKWARTDLGALAMAGSEDPNCDAAKKTVRALRGKVRNVEVRIQQGLGHRYPRELVSYHQWWMGVQDGRVYPGDDRSLEWVDDLDAAIESQEGAKRGGVLVWLYTEDDDEKPAAKNIQHAAFFDPEVRFLARQIPCVRIDVSEEAEPVEALDVGTIPALLEALGVETVPALVVIDRKGKEKKRYEGDFNVSKLARTLRGVAPKRTMRR